MWTKPLDFVLLAIPFAVLTGIGEFAVRWFIAFVLHKPSNQDFSQDLLWMLPSATLLLFGAVGVLVGIACFRWPGDRLMRIAVAIFATASAYALLLHFRSIHWILSFVLSVGLGVRIADILGRRPAQLKRFANRVAWPAVGAVVLAGFVMRAKEAFIERRAVAGLVAPPANAPNVLIIVLDAVRAADLSAYGYERNTSPALQNFARRSVLFESAIVTAPWSLTSHASIFTGRYPHEMSADWDVPLDGTHATLAEVLRNRGYLTAGFVANSYYGRPQFGLGRGFAHYENRRFGPAAMIGTEKLGNALVRAFNRSTNNYYRPGRLDAGEINHRVLRWVPRPGERPFFVFINYFDAHDPYAPPAPYNRFFSRREPPTRRVHESLPMPPADLRGLRDAYDQSIAYLDSRLGALLNELEARQMLSNTVVVVTADHGEEFGEHGWASHGNGLYFPSLHVPLVISFPKRVPGGQTVTGPVTLRDLPATVLDLLGAGDSPALPGNSLARRWASSPDSVRSSDSPVLSEVRAPNDVPAWFALAKGDMKSIILGNHHYIRNGDGREELFDISVDPWEKTNLAGSARYAADLVASRTALDAAALVGKNSGPRTAGQPR
jgi:arylsulfatase A-like enzyme